MSQDAAVIEVGRLDRAAAGQVARELDAVMSTRPRRIVVDLGRVDAFDSAGLGAVVAGMQSARARGVEVKLRGLSRSMLDFFSLLSLERLVTPPPPGGTPAGFVQRLGGAVEPLLASAVAIVRTGAETLHALFVGPFRRHRLRLDRTGIELEAAAYGALPIVILIAFLLGLILAMQAYVQLRVWGAEIYIADMVGVSVMTEIGPLMTAIVLAARSGSSNAAQLGSMAVAEELDALRQMGIHPIRFLVAPKVVALALSVFALGLVFDVVAMAGGALFALLVAGTETSAYQERIQEALKLGDFLVSSSKCLVFGGCVGVVGCALGMRVTGGSEGVGRATTATVVVGIFLIIVIDALFVTVQRMVLA